MKKSLIQTLTELQHLSPDQIVANLHDPIANWVKPCDLTETQLQKIIRDNRRIRFWSVRNTRVDSGTEYTANGWTAREFLETGIGRNYYFRSYEAHQNDPDTTPERTGR